MPAERYISIFKELVKAYNEGKLKEKYEELERSAEDEKIKKYIFAALGLDYFRNATFEDIEKAMDMKQMRGKVVVKVGDCGLRCVGKNELSKCQLSCPFDAIDVDEVNATTLINEDICEDCGRCSCICEYGNIIDKMEYMPLAKILKSDEAVYAIVAPAYIGQLGKDITPGKLRSALKKIGFRDMVEVALFADILTAKEALEFDNHIRKEEDFLITSCCCPMWVALIKKFYSDFVSHVPPSVSPMVACGRTIKKVNEDAKVVFIGPCVAKKAEAKEKDINDAVDFVLTFQELLEIFDALEIDLSEMEEDEGEQASRAGRIYGFTGGVSKAVSDTLNKLRPDRDIKVKAIQANGIKECKAILEKLKDNDIDANFIEGMGCVGGCVGGPKVVLRQDIGRLHVHEYGDSTDMITPLDNPVVYATLKSIGIDEINELLNEDKGRIYERDF